MRSNLKWFLEAIQTYNSDECLLWPFGDASAGNATINFEGQKTSIHRLAFRITHGRWPKPLAIRACHRLLCFNPRHIYEGSQARPKYKPRQSRLLPWLIAALESHKSDDCLIWPFCKAGQNGYGSITIKGRHVPVHRLAFKLVHGHWPFPEGCHSCDTPPCVNPRHIYEASHAINLRDAGARGLIISGTQHKSAKLNPDLVRKIRAECILNDRQFGASALSRKYGVNQKAIWSIVKRITWKHVA